MPAWGGRQRNQRLRKRQLGPGVSRTSKPWCQPLFMGATFASRLARAESTPIKTVPELADGM